MRAVLEFNLPEEDYDFKTATKGNDYLRALEEIDTLLRNKLKYDNKLTEAEDKVLSDVREQLHIIFDNYNIRLFED